MRVGRNDLCPCGSGKKFKNCPNKHSQPKGLLWIGLAIAAVAAVGLIPLFADRDEDRTKQIAAIPAAPQNRPGPQPPGPVPPGKVWNAEHGHWHDAAPAQGGQSPIQITPGPALPQNASVNATPPGGLTPQPKGPVPEGKVWSAEHGHWHDAPKPQ